MFCEPINVLDFFLNYFENLQKNWKPKKKFAVCEFRYVLKSS